VLYTTIHHFLVFYARFLPQSFTQERLKTGGIRRERTPASEAGDNFAGQNSDRREQFTTATESFAFFALFCGQKIRVYLSSSVVLFWLRLCRAVTTVSKKNPCH